MQLLEDLIKIAMTYIIRQPIAANFGDDYITNTNPDYVNFPFAYSQLTTNTLIDDVVIGSGSNTKKYDDLLSLFLYSGQHWTYILSSWIGIISSQLIVAYWGKNKPFDRKEILAMIGFMIISIIIAPQIDTSPIVSLFYGFVVQGTVKYAIDNGLFDKTQGLIAVGSINLATGWLSRLFDSKSETPTPTAIVDKVIPSNAVKTEIHNDAPIDTSVIKQVKPVIEVEVTPSELTDAKVESQPIHTIITDEPSVIGSQNKVVNDVKTERLGNKNVS